MNKAKVGLAVFSIWLASHAANADITIFLTAGKLTDENGQPLPDGATMLLVVDTDHNGFGFLASSQSASKDSFHAEGDKVLARWPLDATTIGADGGQVREIKFDLRKAGVKEGDDLLLVWYSGLKESDNAAAPGPGRHFGTFRASDWKVPRDGDVTELDLLTRAMGGALLDSEGKTDQVTLGAAAP